MAIEIVDFPIKNGDFPLLFVCLPEGNQLGDHSKQRNGNQRWNHQPEWCMVAYGSMFAPQKEHKIRFLS